MALETIPNLWPEIKADSLTPFAILQEQALRLSETTQGLLRAEVVSLKVGDVQRGYDLDLIAPLLNNYRHTILSVRQFGEFAYPVTVEGLTKDVGNGWRHDMKPVPNSSATEPNKLRVGAKFNARPIYNDTDFVERVRRSLQSPQVEGLIYSLIARSNERKTAEAANV